MANKISKNAEKSGVGMVVVAAATIISNAVSKQGIITSDMEPYVTTIISGALFGLVNFIKYTVKSAIEKRKARNKK